MKAFKCFATTAKEQITTTSRISRHFVMSQEPSHEAPISVGWLIHLGETLGRHGGSTGGRAGTQIWRSYDATQELKQNLRGSACPCVVPSTCGMYHPHEQLCIQLSCCLGSANCDFHRRSSSLVGKLLVESKGGYIACLPRRRSTIASSHIVIRSKEILFMSVVPCYVISFLH